VSWREWLKNNLPEALDAHVSGVVERDDTLTIFADSSAWSARLRYLVTELEPAVRGASATVKYIVIKVMPRR